MALTVGTNGSFIITSSPRVALLISAFARLAVLADLVKLSNDGKRERERESEMKLHVHAKCFRSFVSRFNALPKIEIARGSKNTVILILRYQNSSDVSKPFKLSI